MKQKLLLILMLMTTCVYSQESAFYELKTPLNISKCQKCVDSNPQLDIKMFNEIENFTNNYLELTQNSFTPIEFKVDREGKIISSQLDENFIFSNEMTFDKNKVNELFRKCEGKKIFNFSNASQGVPIKFTLSFYYDNYTQKLILNPLTHK